MARLSCLVVCTGALFWVGAAIAEHFNTENVTSAGLAMGHGTSNINLLATPLLADFSLENWPSSTTKGYYAFGSYADNYAGKWMAKGGDVDGDGFPDILLGSLNGNPNIVYVLFGRSGNRANIPSLSAYDTTNVNNRGWRITLYGEPNVESVDFNGDGYSDILIGNGNVVYVIFGRAGPTFPVLALPSSPSLLAAGPSQGFQISGPTDSTGFGRFLASADLNGDGFGDIMIGDKSNTVFVLFGRSNAAWTVANFQLKAAATYTAGPQGLNGEGSQGFKIPIATDYSMSYMRAVDSAGDFNGDGYQDFILGSTAFKGYIIFGKPGNDLVANIDLTTFTSSATTGVKLQGSLEGRGKFFQIVRGVGDVNGDGYSDVAIQSQYQPFVNTQETGVIYVVFGHGPSTAYTTVMLDKYLLPPVGFQIGMQFTAAMVYDGLSSAGDVNGDGYGDLVVGWSNPSRYTYVIYGSSSLTSVNLQGATSAYGIRISPGQYDLGTGSPVAGVGDVNNDGVDDFVIASPQRTGPYASQYPANAGAVYIVYGSNGGFTRPPTIMPTRQPTAVPTSYSPSKAPSFKPTAAPTAKPTSAPTFAPSAAPTRTPTAAPTTAPSVSPSAKPTANPSASPTFAPSAAPSASPTAAPSASPTAAPTTGPTFNPTTLPTVDPTVTPTNDPTTNPSALPSAVPSAIPSAVPTTAPSAEPSFGPTPAPSAGPTADPTQAPTADPTASPSADPSADPSAVPSAVPSALPSAAPSANPTAQPTVDPTTVPSAVPSADPSAAPSASPTTAPSAVPSAGPTTMPTADPTTDPSATPSAVPSAAPTMVPTTDPSASPSAVPSAVPSANPTTDPSAMPSAMPSAVPTASPSADPTAAPTADPTAIPTASPSLVPSAVPSAAPTATPTAAPSAPPFNWYLGANGDSCTQTCAKRGGVCQPLPLNEVTTAEAFSAVVAAAILSNKGLETGTSAAEFCNGGINVQAIAEAPSAVSYVTNTAASDEVSTYCTYPTSLEALQGDCDANYGNPAAQRFCACHTPPELWVQGYSGESCTQTCGRVSRVCVASYFDSIVTQEAFYNMVASAVNVEDGVLVGSAETLCNQGVNGFPFSGAPSAFTYSYYADTRHYEGTHCSFATSLSALSGDCDIEYSFPPTSRFCPCVEGDDISLHRALRTASAASVAPSASLVPEAAALAAPVSVQAKLRAVAAAAPAPLAAQHSALVDALLGWVGANALVVSTALSALALWTGYLLGAARKIGVPRAATDTV